VAFVSFRRILFNFGVAPNNAAQGGRLRRRLALALGFGKHRMHISVPSENNLLAYWQREKILLRAEVVGANVSLWFTGIVARHSTVELVLARDSDELSISLFCGAHKVFEPQSKENPIEGWASFKRVVQITTDGGAQCTIYELIEKAEPNIRFNPDGFAAG
jgi:hypothetical protein